MVLGRNRIPYWIDRRLTGLEGPDYGTTISFRLAFEPEDSQYGKCRLPYVVGALSCSAMNREEGNSCRAAQK